MPKAGEPLPRPQKMPTTGGAEPPHEVRINSTAPTTPAIELAPTSSPGLDIDNRSNPNPF